MKRLSLIILPLVLIVGCSKPIEDSTLINKDGLMYSPNSDKPYTGEVFTNYSTGEKEYQGTYENGLLVSYSFLNKDGSVKEPVNGETLIDRSGLMYEVNGQKPYTGDVFELFENGNRKYSGRLKGGKKDGTTTVWYDNGNKRSEYSYVNGKKNGSFITWFDNGKISSEGQLLNDSLSIGIFKSWYQNGNKRSEMNYKNGVFDGLCIIWSEDGKSKREEIYNNGLPYGVWNYYDNRGVKYKGKPIRVKNDEDGEFLFFNYKHLHPTVYFKMKNNKYEGDFTSWYDNGNKKQEGSLIVGKKVGIWTEWSQNGQKISEGTFKDMNKDGLWTFWNEYGKVDSEGSYNNNYKDGEWNYYYGDGSFWRSEYFDCGKFLKNENSKDYNKDKKCK